MQPTHTHTQKKGEIHSLGRARLHQQQRHLPGFCWWYIKVQLHFLTIDEIKVNLALLLQMWFDVWKMWDTRTLEEKKRHCCYILWPRSPPRGSHLLPLWNKGHNNNTPTTALTSYLSAHHAALLLIQQDVEQRAPQTSADVLTAGTQSLATAGHRRQSCT